jgi:hypothetical protein
MTRKFVTGVAICLAAAVQSFASPPVATVEKFGDEYIFKCDGKVVTRYLTKPTLAKPVLHPMIAPNGVALTRDWPLKSVTPGESTDHIHQKSAWFCHGDVVPEGVTLSQKVRGVRGVDFWSEAPGHGVIEVKSVEIVSAAGPVAAVRSRNAWKSAQGRVILDETRTITLVPVEGAHLIHVKSVLKPSGTDVTFADTKEGSFGVRVSDKLAVAKNPESRITNSLGSVGEKECWGRKADWCLYSGVIDGKPAGIAIFDDPTNRYRASWHVRGYGLMAANPFGRAGSGFPSQKDSPEPPASLKAGEELVLKYGILLYSGEDLGAKLRQYHRQFASLRE